MTDMETETTQVLLQDDGFYKSFEEIKAMLPFCEDAEIWALFLRVNSNLDEEETNYAKRMLKRCLNNRQTVGNYYEQYFSQKNKESEDVSGREIDNAELTKCTGEA